MAVLDRLRPSQPDYSKRLERARTRHQTWLTHWGEQMAFYEGRQFVFKTRNGSLSERAQPEPTEYNWYRARTVRNRIFKVVNAEVSAGTQRVPGYEVIPSSTETEDVAAAVLSEKILLYLHELLSLRRKIGLAWRSAIITGEGFLRPYWDPTLGRRLQGEDGQVLHEGELQIEVLGPEQVLWEPGISFEDSDWHAVEKHMTPEQVKRLSGYTGAEVKPDSVSHGSFVTGRLHKRAAQADTVCVTEYLELPAAQSQGLRVYLVGGKPVTYPEPYPLIVSGPDGYEPVLQKLAYIETPQRDRDMGLVEHLIDAQRTINDSVNKQIEWKNLALNPQIFAGPGGLIDELTDEPGAIFRVKGDPNQVKWREVPQMPAALGEMIDRANEDISEISAQRQIPTQVESGRAIVALLDQDDSVRAHVVQNLADFHSRLGRHLLHLVQRHYAEQRLAKVNGRIGTQHISFRGADLRNQVDVRVLPGSIEPRTKQAVREEVLSYADRGWISPEAAMSAIRGGTADTLIDSFDQDKARATRVIQAILAGEAALFSSFSPNPDGSPGWMPRPFDNIQIHKQIFEDFFKTLDYERAEQPVKQAANLYYQGLLDLETKQAQRAAQLQAQTAEDLGMQNAARPQDKQMPSLPMPGSENGGT